uniref:Uncharacterized protein n=1 Tax=Brassica campestris TaxID=3711 RepID=A0A3P5YLV2_BRACM|nr:unnamed protein product [Brassica rapa]
MEHWEVTGIRVNTKTAVVSPAKKKVRHLQRLVKRHMQSLVNRRSSICRKWWKLWRRRLVTPQNGKGHHLKTERQGHNLKTLPLHLN